jgi:hypothetical protein
MIRMPNSVVHRNYKGLSKSVEYGGGVMTKRAVASES